MGAGGVVLCTTGGGENTSNELQVTSNPQKGPRNDNGDWWKCFKTLLTAKSFFCYTLYETGDFMYKSLTLVLLFGLFSNNAFAVFSAYIEDDMKEQEGYRCGTTACDSTIRQDSGVPDAENCETSARGCFRQTGLPNQGTTYGTIYSVTYCTSCKPGYELKTITADSSRVYECSISYDTCVKSETPPTPSEPCEGLPCEGYTESNPGTDPSNPGREMWCNKNNNRCNYRCADNYYNAFPSSNPLTGGIICKACPSDAICRNGNVCCNTGYYMTRTLETENILTKFYVYNCHRCPKLGDVYGTTTGCPIFGNNSNTTITSCYIPENTPVTIESGTFTFSEPCYYENVTITGPVTGN